MLSIYQPFFRYLSVARPVYVQQPPTSHPPHCHHLITSSPPQNLLSPQTTNHLHTNTLYAETNHDRRISPKPKRTGTICKTTGIFLYDICRAETFVAIANETDRDPSSPSSEQLASHIKKPSISPSQAHDCIAMDIQNTSSVITHTQTNHYTPHDASSLSLGSRTTTNRLDNEGPRTASSPTKTHNEEQENFKTSGRDTCAKCAQFVSGMHVHTFRMHLNFIVLLLVVVVPTVI